MTKSKKQRMAESRKAEDTMYDIDDRNALLKNIIKKYNGRYRGSKFKLDAMKSAGLLEKAKALQEAEEEEERDEEQGEDDAEEKPEKKEFKPDESIPLAKLGFGIESYIDMLSSLTF
jgi:hypothetical protein